MWKLVMIGAGGAVGTMLRYSITALVTRTWGAFLPWGTLTVNVLGSFLLGVLMEALGARSIGGVPAQLVLGTGVMGGFTTYSSFNLETLRLAEQGTWLRATGYAGATFWLCLLAGAGGVLLIRYLKTAG